MTNRLIRNFTFENSIRQGLVFSDPTKIRLNTEKPNDQKIQLKSGSGGFPTGADIFVETPFLTPNGLKKWLSFEAIIKEDPETFLLPANLTLGFKIKTTIGNYYWTGAAWSVAGLSDWSTEAQIRDNIVTFPIATIGNKSIGVVMNLRTSDPNITPEVKELKFLGEFDVEWLEDLVYDCVIRTLNTQLRSSSVLGFQTSGPTTTVALDAVLANKGYNITGIRSVYNVTDDPMKLVNLFSSYAPGVPKTDGFTFEAGTVTLTTSVPASKVLEVNFEYVPEVMVMTGQDFFEIPAYPSIVFENIVTIDRPNFTIRDSNGIGEDFIRNKATLQAVLQYAPKVQNIRFEFAVYTNLQSDQMRLMDDIMSFFERNRTLQNWGLDTQHDVILIQELVTDRNQSSSDSTDTNVAEGIFDVIAVPFYHKPSVDLPLIGPGQLNVNTTLLN